MLREVSILVMEKLPVDNYTILKYVISFLSRVSAKQLKPIFVMQKFSKQLKTGCLQKLYYFKNERFFHIYSIVHVLNFSAKIPSRI